MLCLRPFLVWCFHIQSLLRLYRRKRKSCGSSSYLYSPSEYQFIYFFYKLNLTLRARKLLIPNWAVRWITFRIVFPETIKISWSKSSASFSSDTFFHTLTYWFINSGVSFWTASQIGASSSREQSMINLKKRQMNRMPTWYSPFIEKAHNFLVRFQIFFWLSFDIFVNTATEF